jgi:serine/threonine protein kinase
LDTGHLQPGMVLAGYRLDSLLGQGGMGVVYEATQLSLDRTVALKIVTPGLSANMQFRARFRREGLAQARLEHPNIVTVYEAGEFEDILFLAMRLVRGTTLKDMIVGRELDPARTLRILKPVSEALDSAHETGLIHRDVKPHNILVAAKDHPYLADFGLTKSAQDTAGLTRSREFMGTLDYIAPEQIRGEPATSASDVYAFGAVLFECLTGAVPFPKDSEAAVLYAHVAETPPLLSARQPSLPALLDGVLARAMAKEPHERPTSNGELMRAVESAFTATTIRVRRPDRGEAAAERGVRRGEEAQAKPKVRVQGPGELPDASPLQLHPPMRGAVPDPASTTPQDTSPGVEPISQRTRSPRSTRWAAVIGIAVATLIVAGGGFAIGHSGRKAPRGAPSRQVSQGHLKLTVPLAWEQPAAAPSIPGLTFTDEIVREDRASGGLLIAGLLPNAGGGNLLPSTFTAALKSAPSTNDPVRIGDASAYRYRGLSATGVAS